jgi:ech hydrogenase subunit B
MTLLKAVLAIAFLIGGPFLGGLIVGIDRKVSARMQGRVGPPILQPFYDVAKLLGKERATVSTAQDIYIVMYLVFVVISGCLFFAGGNFLLVTLLVTMASLFLVIAAYNTRSPFAEAGAQRENLQVMAYEPMVLLTAAGFYLATGTFDVAQIGLAQSPAILKTFLLFIGFLFILTIKLRKSPFDISTSEHAHQELVKGVTTEFAGRTLARYEIAHWYETVLFLGWTALFIIWGSPVGVVVALVAVVVLYFLEIWIDNNFARVKWQVMLRYSWWAAFGLGGANILYLYIINLL